MIVIHAYILKYMCSDYVDKYTILMFLNRKMLYLPPDKLTILQIYE